MMFLSETRRQQLIQNLSAIGMPHDAATRWASGTDHLGRLDQHLSAVLLRLGERCHLMQAAARCGNKQAQYQHQVFIQCDLAIFTAYREEIIERRIPTRQFPRINRAIAESLAEIERSKVLILQAMGKTGMLQ